jgi:hypothetical protein
MSGLGGGGGGDGGDKKGGREGKGIGSWWAGGASFLELRLGWHRFDRLPFFELF